MATSTAVSMVDQYGNSLSAEYQVATRRWVVNTGATKEDPDHITLPMEEFKDLINGVVAVSNTLPDILKQLAEIKAQVAQDSSTVHGGFDPAKVSS